MTTLIKLGGSLITDKRVAKSFRRDAVRGIAAQLAALRKASPDLPIVLGHGSGSFGHVEASKHQTVAGALTAAERLGMARVGAVAAELSALILRELLEARLPALRFPPSALLTTRNGEIAPIETRALSLALAQGHLPLTHGDIAIDSQIGGTIVSTEAVFAALAQPLSARRIILLGEVAGVLDAGGRVIPRITAATFPALAPLLGASGGVDVTGGMLHKVKAMVDLVAREPTLEVIIADGRRADILLDLLLHGHAHGTRICADTVAP